MRWHSSLSEWSALTFFTNRGVPSAVSRRFAPVIGGLAYLVAVFYVDAWTAFTLSAISTVSIALLHVFRRRQLRGIRGNRPSQELAEVTYPLAGTFCLLIGWEILGDRWLAFLPLAFMAWGDSVAGLVRSLFLHGRTNTIMPSAAMLGICLAIAGIYQPYWVGVAGAVAATAAECFRPGFLRFFDDNFNIVAFSMTLMILLKIVSYRGII